MADDRKRDEAMHTRVTERMALDLLRLSALHDKQSISEYIYRVLRNHMYGETVRLAEMDAQQEQRLDSGR